MRVRAVRWFRRWRSGTARACPPPSGGDDPTRARRLSAAFTRALGPRQRWAAGSRLGAEFEYKLTRGNQPLDFRYVVHRLGLDHARLDPGDVNAYRLKSGAALTCDDREAELALPPVEVRRGFTERLASSAAYHHGWLSSVLPLGVATQGESTHLSVSMPGALTERVALLYTRTFAPALILLMDGPSSPGLLVRPRPGRVELCGEYLDGARLQAAAAFAVGSVRACGAAAADSTLGELLPPRIALTLETAVARYGWYVDRRAFGVDLLSRGRRASLTLADGGTIIAQQHLVQAWRVAREALGARAGPQDLRAADGLVSGALPLAIEGSFPDLDGRREQPLIPNAYGRMLLGRRRPGLEVTPVMATWGLGLFLVMTADGRRRAFACVPGELLDRFLRLLDGGRLDHLLSTYLALSPSGRSLTQRVQTGFAGLYDTIGQRYQLLPFERDPEGPRRIPPRPSASPTTGQHRPGPQGGGHRGGAAGIRLLRRRLLGPRRRAAHQQPAGRRMPKLTLIGAGIMLAGGIVGGLDAAQVGPFSPVPLIPAVTVESLVSDASAATGRTQRQVAAPPAPTYQCVGNQFKLFDNWNRDRVDNGASAPTFSTGGKPYCLVAIATYHWNDGRGQVPGKISLTGRSGTLGPWAVEASAGQEGAPNVNWVVNLSPSRPVILDGTYTCQDSDPASWSQNKASAGQGFCWVSVQSALVTTPGAGVGGTGAQGAGPLPWLIGAVLVLGALLTWIWWRLGLLLPWGGPAVPGVPTPSVSTEVGEIVAQGAAGYRPGKPHRRSGTPG